MAVKIHQRIDEISAALNVEMLLKFKIGRCHSLLNNRKGQYAMDLIHPYRLYVYNGSWFVLAWNETINDFGYFKLNRIQTVEKQREHLRKLWWDSA